MTDPMFLAIDPAETREIDPQRFVLEGRVRDAKAAAASAPSESAEAAAQSVAAAEAALAAYQPTGLLVTIGHIPEAKWAELMALHSALPKEQLAGAGYPKLVEWQRELVRWGVRGHRGLKDRKGGEFAFEAEEVAFLGDEHLLPSKRTLEIYFRAQLTPTLASLVFRSMTLGPDLGNG